MNIKFTIKKILLAFLRKKYLKRDFGSIGKNVIIGDDCAIIPRNMYLEDNTIIQNRVNFISHRGKLIVKQFSVISSECIIIPSTHLAAVGVPFYYQAKDHFGDEDNTIVIEEDCWVGAGSILLNKCRLGRGCVVAAGSVVTKPIPPYAVVAGVPARIIGVKFSKEDIVQHERLIYPENDRISRNQLNSLWEKYYTQFTPMKKSEKAEKSFRESSNKQFQFFVKL